MGHRALVAYQVGADQYNVHYSHWGAHNLELEQDISSATPAGSENMEPAFMTAIGKGLTSDPEDLEDAEMSDEDKRIAGVFATLTDASEETDISGYATEAGEDTPVERTPLKTNITFAEAVAEVDSQGAIESFYHVSPDFEVTGFHVHFVRTGEREESTSLLVRPRWLGGEPISLANDKGWLNGLEAGLSAGSQTPSHEMFVREVVDKYERASGSKYILAHSSALRDQDGEFIDYSIDDVGAFVPVSGATRMHPFGDYMLVSSYGRSMRDWMIPTDLTLPIPYRADTPDIPGVEFVSPHDFGEEHPKP